MQIKKWHPLKLFPLFSVLITGCPPSQNDNSDHSKFPNHVIGKWKISKIRTELKSSEIAMVQNIIQQKNSTLLFSALDNGKATLEFRKTDQTGAGDCSLTLYYDIWYCCAEMRKVFFMTDRLPTESPSGCIERELSPLHIEEFATHLRELFTPNLPDEFSISQHHFTHSKDHLDLELPYGAPNTWMRLEPISD